MSIGEHYKEPIKALRKKTLKIWFHHRWDSHAFTYLSGIEMP